MPMNMEIPAMPAPRPATPKAKAGKTAQGSGEDFRTTLKEENCKQASGKRREEPKDDSRQDTDQVVAGGANPAVLPDKTSEPVAEIEGKASPVAETANQAATVEEMLSPADNKGEMPKAGAIPEPIAEKAQAVTAKTGGGQETPNPEPVQVESGKMADGALNANNQSTGELKVGKTETGELKSSEGAVLEQAAAAAKKPVPQPSNQVLPLEKQLDSQEPKTAQAGLMDASFAGLLNPEAARDLPGKGNGLHSIRLNDGALPIGQENSPAAADEQAVTIENAEADLSEALLKHSEDPSASLEDMEFRQPHDKGQPSLFDNTLASTGVGKTEFSGQTNPLQGAAGPMASFAGSLNEEVRVMDQVLNQLPLNRLGEKNRVVIRLHPEELGEVKLDLVMDKDQLKAHLVTQTQQVQSILEKHLPRLQEALHSQGIKLDQVEVSVDSQADQGREFSGREQQSTSWAGNFGSQAAVPEPAQVAAAVNQARTTQSGLSLRI